MTHRADIVIGGVRVAVTTTSPTFLHLLQDRYAGFMQAPAPPDFELGIDLVAAAENAPDEDVRVYRDAGLWRIERGDFRAHLDPLTGRGRVRQSENPYSIDTVLRIVHTLALAREGGFLMHAASALRGGRAFLFAGVSGAGKTTLSRLAPADALLLSDEISYLRRAGAGYHAFGTPFAGEIARAGENVHAPLEAIYLLAKGPRNVVEAVPAAQAARELLASVLFFAEDAGLVRAVFEAALDLAERVPVRRLTFVPDARVWDQIGRQERAA